MKLSIIVPVYNEEKTIVELLNKLISVNFEMSKELLIVNDGSTDNTFNLIRDNFLNHVSSKDSEIRFISYEQNRGKGYAIRMGLKCATGDIICIQDGDLEYNPNDLYSLVKLINNGHDVVYGSRFMGNISDMSISHRFGNKLLSLVTSILYNTQLTDIETCYKVIKKDILKASELKSDDFNIEPEITAKILKKGYHIHEYPISYYGRNHANGKKISWRDGVNSMIFLIKERIKN